MARNDHRHRRAHPRRPRRFPLPRREQHQLPVNERHNRRSVDRDRAGHHRRADGRRGEVRFRLGHPGVAGRRLGRYLL